VKRLVAALALLLAFGSVVPASAAPRQQPYTQDRAMWV
jgi:hypothetical protein